MEHVKRCFKLWCNKLPDISSKKIALDKINYYKLDELLEITNILYMEYILYDNNSFNRSDIDKGYRHLKDIMRRDIDKFHAVDTDKRINRLSEIIEGFRIRYQLLNEDINEIKKHLNIDEDINDKSTNETIDDIDKLLKELDNLNNKQINAITPEIINIQPVTTAIETTTNARTRRRIGRHRRYV